MGLICSECGNHPGDAGAIEQGLRRRARLAALLVFLPIVLMLAVGALPWVQDRLGNWNAIWDDGPNYGGSSPVGLIDPPVRWADLERVSEGDPRAIEQLRLSIENLPEWYRLYAGDTDGITHAFNIGLAQSLWATHESDHVTLDGKDYAYRLSSVESRGIGWPSVWMTKEIRHLYAYGDQRFEAEASTLSVDADMTHASSSSMQIRWGNIAYTILLVVICGFGVRRACLMVGVCQRRATMVGVLVLLVVGISSLIGGFRSGSISEQAIYGHFGLALSENKRDWHWDEIEDALRSDSATQFFAQTLIDEFGEITHPNELVVLSSSANIGESSYDLNFGYWRFRLLNLGHTKQYLRDVDWTATQIDFDRDVPFFFANGMASVGITAGSPKSYYGALILHRNIFFVLVGLYVIWRGLRWAAWRQQRRVVRRRQAKSVCIWCRYPCSESS